MREKTEKNNNDIKNLKRFSNNSIILLPDVRKGNQQTIEGSKAHLTYPYLWWCIYGLVQEMLIYEFLFLNWFFNSLDEEPFNEYGLGLCPPSDRLVNGHSCMFCRPLTLSTWFFFFFLIVRMLLMSLETFQSLIKKATFSSNVHFSLSTRNFKIWSFCELF